jgi:hypothetical protein
MTEKKTMGRPIKPIDYPKLESLCKIQCTKEECAAVLDISEDTLERRLAEDGHETFAVFFKKYSGQGKSSLRRLQWKSAQNGNVTMQIWLGKNNLGQRDHNEVTYIERKAEPIVIVDDVKPEDGT